MNDTDMSNASFYFEQYVLEYLLRNKYITREEYDKIVFGCRTENRIFFVSKVINLGV